MTSWLLQLLEAPLITEAFHLVRIEGTLDEIRELVGDVKRTARTVRSTGKKVVKAAKKTTRKLSAWQRYLKGKANHIKFKSGDKKGRLNLAAMSKKFKKGKGRK